jgi:hypothetical protein
MCCGLEEQQACLLMDTIRKVNLQKIHLKVHALPDCICQHSLYLESAQEQQLSYTCVHQDEAPHPAGR